MSNFMETYGKALFVIVLVAILIAFASPIGVKIKTAVLAQVDKIASIGNDEIENRNPKNYEAVDIEKSWTESHTGSYFFERVSSDKTNDNYNKWKSNNNNIDDTSAISTFTIDVPKDIEYPFDWTVSSESNYDKLTITCNETTIIDRVSGINNGTEKITLKSGTNTLTVTYSKDSSGADGDDCATITLPDVKVSSCKNKQTGEISNHNYDKGKITKEATCTKNGEKTFTCKNCGKTKTEVIEKLDHNFVNEVCTRCGYDISKISAVDQVYCIYYDDGEMTISQNEIEPEVGRTVVNEGFYTAPSDCTIEMTTVRFVDIIKPKSCKKWFAGCKNLAQLKNMKNLYTNKCTDMFWMFNGCWSLTNLDLSNFDTSKVTNMQAMFIECNHLINLDVSNFNTSNVTNMENMFRGCSSLTNLDLSNFDTIKVTDMSSMFYWCRGLTNLSISNFDTSNVTDMGNMFSDCMDLISLNLSNFNTSKVTNMNGMFMDCESLTSLDLSGFNTIEVTDMGNMFSECYSLTNLNLSNFDTIKVTNMSGMFSKCRNLISLNLHSFDISNVRSMSAMFKNCYRLTNLDLSGFTTSKVTDMGNMFYNCKALTSIDLSNFNTSNVWYMNGMFYNCSSLTNLDLSKFDTSKVLWMNDMFNNCKLLTNLNLSNFDTIKVTNMKQMFQNCNNLKSIIATQTVKDKILSLNTSVPSGCTWTIVESK